MGTMKDSLGFLKFLGVPTIKCSNSKRYLCNGSFSTLFFNLINKNASRICNAPKNEVSYQLHFISSQRNIGILRRIRDTYELKKWVHDTVNNRFMQTETFTTTKIVTDPKNNIEEDLNEEIESPHWTKKRKRNENSNSNCADTNEDIKIENGFVKSRKNRIYGDDNMKRSNHSYSRYSLKFNEKERRNDKNKKGETVMLQKQLKEIDWTKVELVEPENLYEKEYGDIPKLSSEELSQELKKNQIKIEGKESVDMIMKFSDLRFPTPMIDYLNSQFEHPSPIQKITWPIALSGKDLISVAETGSGKTLAYLIPAIAHILKKKNYEQKDDIIKKEVENEKEIAFDTCTDSYVLVLVPTRELCTQVLGEMQKFENMLQIRGVALYGGAPKIGQIENLKKGADILICTPGRLLDLLEMQILNLTKIVYMVIDEADRLLDMGFEPQIRQIMSQVNKKKQVLFLTATWPEQVRQLAYDLCNQNPVKIQIGQNALTANKNIEQEVIVSSSVSMKKKFLEWLKKNYENNKILIFCETKRACDVLGQELRYHQYNALSLHGDKSQRERDRIMRNFKTDKCNILVATNVAARGLDIKNVSIVINYDIPSTLEDYIHRIGRTGRGGNKGHSVLFFSYDYYVPQKVKFAKELIYLMNQTNQHIPKELSKIANGR